MSGIVGFLTADPGSPVPAEALQAMTAALPRGGDDASFHRSPNVGLGGALYVNEAQTVYAVAAGDVVNAAPLMGELACRSLAELVARGYERWGFDGLVRRLDGSFAVGVWDGRTRTAHLARDPLGRRSIFYADRNRRFAFGSELSYLLHAGLIDGNPDDLALWGYLRYQFTPGERTLLAGVRELPAGCQLQWRDGIVTVRRYWDLADAAAKHEPPGSFEDADARLRQLFLERKRQAGDGPVLQESAPVEEAAALRWINGGGPWAGDEPLADPAALPLWFQALHAGGPVVSTAGADEVLAAQPFYRPRTQRYRLEQLHPGLRRSADMIAAMADTFHVSLKQGRLTVHAGGAEASPISGRPYAVRDDFAWALLHPDRRPDFPQFREHLAKLESRLLVGHESLGELRQAQYLETHLWLAEQVSARLRLVPGLDVRAPFLHPELAAYTFALPEEWLVGPEPGPRLLRDLYTPEPPRQWPVERWLRGELSAQVRETLLGPVRSLGLFDPAVLRFLAEDKEAATPELARCLWGLLLLGRWHERVRGEITEANRKLRTANQCYVPRTEPDWGEASQAEDAAALPRCDIAVPIYEGIALVRDLLRTIEAYTDPAVTPYHVWLIDDGSDPHSFARLQEMVRDRPRMTLLRNDTNLGFVATANRGLAMGDAPLVVLLNSDTLVTPGWLERVVRCALSDDRIALVNPLSNRSDNLSLELPPGLGLENVAAKVAEAAPTYPDIVTAVGFCLLVKRKYLDWLGGLDPIFGMGYCEESDLHMRMRDAGLRAVLADDAYVYHMGNGSFGATWVARYEANRKIFDGRWEDQYWRDLKCFQRHAAIERIQNRLLENTVPLKGYHEEVLELVENVVGEPKWTAAQPVGDYAFSRGQWKRFVRWQGQRLNRRRANGDDRAVFFPSAPYVSRLPRAKGLRITFLLYGLESSGGVLSIIQLAREWLLAGHDVQFVTTITDAQNLWPERINLPCQPLIYPSEERLVRDFPASDIVIPTYWLTAYRWLPRLKERHQFKSVYYVQDYEAWFYPDEHPDRDRVIETFGMTDERVVKSQWLADLLAAHGQDSIQIHQGIDLDIFYPRQRRRRERPRVLACARPHEPRRGFGNLVRVYERLHQQRPDVELCLYGSADADLKHFDLPFPYTNFQRIYDLNRVARLQSECDILLDPSLYQAFGMPGIEAMACGTATVLPNIGGILEYAIDRQNTLLVTPADERATVRAIVQLLDDAGLREQLVRNAFEQPPKFCHRHEARLHLELYERLLNASYQRPLAATA